MSLVFDYSIDGADTQEPAREKAPGEGRGGAPANEDASLMKMSQASGWLPGTRGKSIVTEIRYGSMTPSSVRLTDEGVFAAERIGGQRRQIFSGSASSRRTSFIRLSGASSRRQITPTGMKLGSSRRA